MSLSRRQSHATDLKIRAGAASLLGALLAALTIAVGTAGAEPASAFRSPEHCQTVGALTICFEAWGVDKVTESASGHELLVSHVHRRFSEFVGGVLTFEQRDMSHHMIQMIDGEAWVENSMFVGRSTPPTLGVCRWRDHLVLREGEVLHSVDELSCSF